MKLASVTFLAQGIVVTAIICCFSEVHGRVTRKPEVVEVQDNVPVLPKNDTKVANRTFFERLIQNRRSLPRRTNRNKRFADDWWQTTPDPWNRQTTSNWWNRQTTPDWWNRQTTSNWWNRQTTPDWWNRQTTRYWWNTTPDWWNRQTTQDWWNRQTTRDWWNRQTTQDWWNRQTTRDWWNRQTTPNWWNRQTTPDRWNRHTTPRTPESEASSLDLLYLHVQNSAAGMRDMVLWLGKLIPQLLLHATFP